MSKSATPTIELVQDKFVGVQCFTKQTATVDDQTMATVYDRLCDGESVSKCGRAIHIWVVNTLRCLVNSAHIPSLSYLLTVKAGCWPWLESFAVRKSLQALFFSLPARMRCWTTAGRRCRSVDFDDCLTSYSGELRDQIYFTYGLKGDFVF